MKQFLKNYKGLIIIFIGILALVIFGIILVNKNSYKSFDLTEVSEIITRYYSDINLEEVESENIDYFFSLPSNEISSSLLLTNFIPQEYDSELSEDEEETIPCLLLIINDINKDKIEDYYESLSSYVLSYVDSDTQKEDIKDLYSNSILKKGKNYIYFIMGDNASIIEKEILELYK